MNHEQGFKERLGFAGIASNTEKDLEASPTVPKRNKNRKQIVLTGYCPLTLFQVIPRKEQSKLQSSNISILEKDFEVRL